MLVAQNQIWTLYLNLCTSTSVSEAHVMTAISQVLMWPLAVLCVLTMSRPLQHPALHTKQNPKCMLLMLTERSSEDQ